VIRYLISDRRLSGGVELLLDVIARNVAAGVDWIQIREKDLRDRELLDLARRVVAIRGAAKVLINGRADIALACDADGVHLPADSIAPRELRRIVPEGFLIGVSCHTIAGLQMAEAEGASFAVYGPVFPPLSKREALPAIGLEGLAAGCRSVRMPVLALGGITSANASACVEAGAAGVAGITLGLET
jgi:thiamine-phosphate pyrophosphorylase